MQSKVLFTLATGAEFVIEMRAFPISAEIAFEGVASVPGELISSGVDIVLLVPNAETTCICVETSCAARLNLTADKPNAANLEPDFCDKNSRTTWPGEFMYACFEGEVFPETGAVIFFDDG